MSARTCVTVTCDEEEEDDEGDDPPHRCGSESGSEVWVKRNDGGTEGVCVCVCVVIGVFFSSVWFPEELTEKWTLVLRDTKKRWF